MTDTLQLQEALATGGIRAVNFFNGRLLSARDLSRVDEARREGDKRLGNAIGDGVAFGLDLVEPMLVGGVPVVSVTPGLAINRLGQALRLTTRESVALARTFAAEAGSGGFGYCLPQVSGGYVAGAGAYLLTIAPAVKREGAAQVSGTDPGNVRCNSDVEVEAVQFRLLSVPAALLQGLSVAAPDFRNALAYRCFGPRAHADLALNPLLASPPPEDLLDGMARSGLSPADVPLALLSFERATDLRFIDQWAVRRPVSPADEAEPGLATLGQARRAALGTAMLRQFAAHLADVTPGSLRADTHFRYLPAAGLLPLAPGEDCTRFFRGMTTRGPLHINAAELESLLRDGLTRPPMVTRPAAPERDRAMVWLYRVAEHAIATDGGGNQRPYLAFATGHIPPRADARFDLFRFDYANVALVL